MRILENFIEHHCELDTMSLKPEVLLMRLVGIFAYVIFDILVKCATLGRST